MKSRFPEQLREFLQDLTKRDCNLVQQHVEETAKAWDKAKETLTPILQQTVDALKKCGRNGVVENGDDITLTIQLHGKTSQRTFDFSPVSHKHQEPRLLVSEKGTPLFEQDLEKLTSGVAETLVLKLLILTAYNQKL